MCAWTVVCPWCKWYQSHILLETRMVLRVGTVINHWFSPDLVWIEFPMNGLISLDSGIWRVEGAWVSCWSACGGPCSGNYLNWLRTKLWLFYVTMSNIIRELSRASSSISLRPHDSSASTSNNYAYNLESSSFEINRFTNSLPALIT